MKNKFTEDSIVRTMTGLLVPILLSGLIQQLYGTANLILIGRYAGADATAAAGASDLIITCLIGFFTGISVGTNVAAAHILGTNSAEQMPRLLQTVLKTGIAGGVCLAVIGSISAPVLLSWMNTPKDILPTAVTYLRVYMLSVVSIVIFNLCAGVFRAMGNPKIPMIFQAVAAVVHIGVGILLVAFLKKGAQGAAIATFFSQTCAAFLSVWFLYAQQKGNCFAELQRSFDYHLLKKILRIGVPSGIQAMVITLSNITIQSQINRFGVDIIAAFTNYFKIEMLLYMPILAYSDYQSGAA